MLFWEVKKMVLVGKVKYLSSENKTSTKGNNYKLSSFLQEGSAEVLMCMDNSINLALKFGQEIVGLFEYNPKFSKMTFIGVQG